jgi:hypothetical protein
MHLFRSTTIQRIFSISLLLTILNFSLNTINDFNQHGQTVQTAEIESFSEMILEEMCGFTGAIQDTEENDQESSAAASQLIWHPAPNVYRLAFSALRCTGLPFHKPSHYTSHHSDRESPPPQLAG